MASLGTRHCHAYVVGATSTLSLRAGRTQLHGACAVNDDMSLVIHGLYRKMYYDTGSAMGFECLPTDFVMVISCSHSVPHSAGCRIGITSESQVTDTVLFSNHTFSSLTE